MYSLLIDTSTPYLNLAIECHDQNSSGRLESKIEQENSHIELLQSEVCSILEQLEIKSEDLDEIILCSGPGSFTGLRIAYTFASGFACAAKIPVYAYSALKVMLNGQADAVSIRPASKYKSEKPELSEYFCQLSGQNAAIKKYPEVLELLQKYQLVSDQELPALKAAGYSYQVINNLLERLFQYHLLKNDIPLEYCEQALADLEPLFLRPVLALKISER